jgi:hypothetical protein
VFSKAGEPQTDGQQHASFRSPAPGTLRDRANGSSFLVHDGVIHIHNDDVKIHAMFAFFSVFFVIHSHDRLGGRLQGVQANWGGRGRGGFAGEGQKIHTRKMKVGGVGEIAMRREMKKNAEKEQGKNIFVVVPKKNPTRIES